MRNAKAGNQATRRTLVAACLISSSLTFLVTWAIFREHSPPLAQPSDVALGVFHSGDAIDLQEQLDSLRKENDDLRAKLARTQDDLTALENKRLQDFFAEALKRIVETTETRTNIKDTFQEGMRRITLKEGEFLGSLGTVMNMMRDFGAMGDVGIDFLLDVANDPSRDMKDRKTASEILVFIPHKRSLEFLATDHPEVEYKAMESLGYMADQIMRLPTDDVRPVMETLKDHVAQQLGHGSFNRESVDLLTTLALVHDDADSRRRLEELRNTPGIMEQVLERARWLGTNEARSYVDRVSRTNPSAATRQRAAAILENW